ncbi:MAG: xanthine dehydrogenase family protein molybdopterin-binding subunit [bacterium]
MAERFYKEMFGAPGEEEDVVGRSLPRVDGPVKAAGAPVYAADHKPPNPLYVAPVLAPVPCGTLERLDLSAARKAPGVACVLTAEDIPGSRRYGMMMADQPVLVEERIFSRQDVVALVAAETAALAESAARLVRMKVRELPAVFDVMEALKEGAPIVQPNHPKKEGGNILARYKIRKGDPEKGFAEADVIVENVYDTQLIDHAYIEPDTGYVVPNPDGSITCTGPTQCPHMVRRVAGSVLNLPQTSIRFLSTPPGGGFGGKEETSFEIAMRAGLVALKTGRTAVYTYTREESLSASAKRVPLRIEHKIGARKDGTITAVRIHVYLDKGPYAGVAGGPPPMVGGILRKLIIHAPGPYACENIWVDASSVFTNNPNTCAMRGLGVPQVHFACESQMEELALRLGMDPFELRRRNCFREGSVTATRQVLDQSVGLLPCLDAAERAAGPHPRAGGKSPALRGRGMAAFWYSTGTGLAGDAVGASIHAADDGKVQVGVGIVELGQGSDTVLSQIAAEAVGVPIGDVRMMPVDTDAMPESGFTAGSRSTTFPGLAICRAAEEIHASLAPVAAGMLEGPTEDVEFKRGRVFIKGAPERSLSFGEVVTRAMRTGKRITGQGWFTGAQLTFDPETGEGDPYVVYSYGVQVADVEVDPGTGEIRVVKILAAHDVGRAINPQAVEGQVEGGVAMGLGQSLIEEVETRRGEVLTPDLARYEIPVSADMPEIESIIIEEPNALGPFGAKGVGESAMVPTLAAIANAVRDATGLRFYRLPITAERVALALHAEKGRAA